MSDDTKVTLKRNPKTDGLRRAMSICGGDHVATHGSRVRGRCNRHAVQNAVAAPLTPSSHRQLYGTEFQCHAVQLFVHLKLTASR